MFRKIQNTVDEVSPFDSNELLLPHIDFCSNKEAYIDGSTGILEYTKETVRLNCKNVVLKFIGNELSVKAESIDRITVYGNIFSLEFSTL